MALATPFELADFLGVDPFTQNDLRQAEVMLDAASGAVQDEADLAFEQTVDDTVELSGSWHKVLWLPNRPVTAVSAVSIDDNPLTEDVDFKWTRSGRLIRISTDALGRRLQASGWWGGEWAVVSVTYSHGFAEVPWRYKRIVLHAAARGMDNPTALRSEQIDDYSKTHADDTAGLELTDAEKDSLQRLRVPAG